MFGVELTYLSSLSVLFPTVLGVAFFGKQPVPIKILSAYIFLKFILEAWSISLHFFGENNMFLFHTSTYIEITTFGLFYFLTIKNKISRLFILVSYFAFICISVYSHWDNGSFEFFNSKQRAIETVILTLWVILAFRDLPAKGSTPFIERHPYFLLSAGLFLYFLGTFPMNAFSDRLELNDFIVVWSISSLLNITLNIIYCVVLWKSQRLNHLL